MNPLTSTARNILQFLQEKPLRARVGNYKLSEHCCSLISQWCSKMHITKYKTYRTTVGFRPSPGGTSETPI